MLAEIAMQVVQRASRTPKCCSRGASNCGSGDDDRAVQPLPRPSCVNRTASRAIPILQDPACSDDKANPAYRNLLAAAYGLIGADSEALDVYERLLADFPKQTSIWMNYGHHLRAIGRTADAMTAYRRSAAFSRSPGDAFWSLANMKLSRFADEDIAAMREQAARTELGDEDRVQIHYALGKALEDRDEYAAAFEHYAIGARIRRPGRPYSADDTSAKLKAAAETFTAEFFAERSGFGADTDEPIFIVGLPRAGSTLIEQILASHSQVEGTMELPRHRPDRSVSGKRGRRPRARAAIRPAWPSVDAGR